MAFLRYAYAQDHRLVNPKAWGQVRVASTETPVSPNLIEQASEILQRKFNPDDYLLTHATIVASVDTYDVPGVRLGSFQEGGRRIERKYANYRIDPKCDPWINNNHDSWERDVLLKSYPTFVGAHNFVEHVQIEEQSKGRILDACARDIGDSVYVDILIATDRKHRGLIGSIQSGELGTLSMGCSIDFSQCTKCGHVAVDEADMCQHVRYEKGNYFYDEAGRRHRIAELCGHRSVDPTAGVRFIEGSWVGIPAFGGAVLRTILTPGELTTDQLKKAQALILNPPRVWSSEALHGIAKAATLLATAAKSKQGFDFGGDDDDDDDDSGGGGDDKTTIEQLEDVATEEALRRMKKKIREDINPPETVDETKETITDENVNRQAAHRRWVGGVYRDTLETITKMASSDAALINGIAEVNNAFGVNVPVEVYRAALRVGSTTRHNSVQGYLRACGRAMGRAPTFGESRTLVRLGNLLARQSG
jgi:hypothetical protein